MKTMSDKEKKGRKPYIPTPDQRERVRAMVADEGADVPAIAAALDLSPPTVRKAFAEELIPPAPLLEAAPVHQAPARCRRKPKRTKPRYTPSHDDRRRVVLWLAASIDRPPLELLAERLSISVPTFRQAFAAELADATARARLALIDRLQAASQSGNVTATQTLLDMVEKRAINDQARRFGEAETETSAMPTRPAKVGKKLAADIDARTAASAPEWNDLLKPGMLAS